MGLFEDIYNTVARFFRPQEVQEGEDTKSVATNRLKLVLMQDRTNLTPRILEQMRSELIDLLSRYVELDKELLELNFEQEGDQVALMLSIPVIRAKDEEEIEAAIKEHQESMKAKNSEDEDENDDTDSDKNEEDTEESDIEIEDSETSKEIAEVEDEEEISDDIAEETTDEIQTVSTPEEMTSSKQEDSSEKVEEKEEV